MALTGRLPSRVGAVMSESAGTTTQRHGETAETLRRSTDLVVERLGDELIVLDEQAAVAHALSGRAADVFLACAEPTTVSDLVRRFGDDDETAASISKLIELRLF